MTMVTEYSIRRKTLLIIPVILIKHDKITIITDNEAPPPKKDNRKMTTKCQGKKEKKKEGHLKRDEKKTKILTSYNTDAAILPLRYWTLVHIS